MPTLEFKGKQFVYSHYLSVPFREMKVAPDKSLPAEGQKPSLDDNLFIHGVGKRRHCVYASLQAICQR